jgi:predicted CoA-binding protein
MDAPLRELLVRIYAETNTIAVVVASGDPSKPAHSIPRYLQLDSRELLSGGVLLMSTSPSILG